MAKKADATALLEPNTIVPAVSEVQSPPNVVEEKPKPAEPTPNEAISDDLGVIIEAPLGHCETGYATSKVNFEGMTTRQAAAYKRLTVSLDAGNYRIPMRGGRFQNGKVCHEGGDAIRWLLEQLANSYEEATGRDITEGLSFYP